MRAGCIGFRASIPSYIAFIEHAHALIHRDGFYFSHERWHTHDCSLGWMLPSRMEWGTLSLNLFTPA